MPRQANGTYLPPANTAAVSGTTISSTAYNTLETDIGTEITNSVDRLGRSAMQAALPMGNNKITGLATPTASTDAATKAYVDTFPIPDKSVTLQKLYHPSGPSLLLGTDSVPALSITGAANNGSGLIRLTVPSAALFATGQVKTVSDVVGTTEANGTWTITVVDSTHIDLQGSTFVNGYASGGSIGGGVAEITLGGGLTMSASILSASNNPGLLPNFLSGLAMNAGGASPNMSIGGGVANDSTGSSLMNLASSIIKNTASWVVGSTSGGLDTGAIASNTWYHFFLIKRPDTGVVDVLFSLNPSTPTMPANYTLKRRIGAGRTDGSSNWVAFTQIGDQFLWGTPVADLAATATMSRVATPLTVPTGISVNALFRGVINASGAGTLATIFTSAFEADATPVNTTNCDLSAAVSGFCAGSFQRMTNTSAQIGVRSTNTIGSVAINTYGWIDTRGK